MARIGLNIVSDTYATFTQAGRAWTAAGLVGAEYTWTLSEALLFLLQSLKLFVDEEFVD